MLLALQKSLIKCRYHWIFIRLFNNGYLICVINTCGTRCLCAVSCQSRLTTAHDTTSATGHDFYQMVFLLSSLYLFHDFACIRQSAGHADLYFQSLIRNREFSDKAFIPHTTFCDLLDRCLAVIRGQTTNHGLRDASGHAKDHTTAGTKSKRNI